MSGQLRLFRILMLLYVLFYIGLSFLKGVVWLYVPLIIPCLPAVALAFYLERKKMLGALKFFILFTGYILALIVLLLFGILHFDPLGFYHFIGILVVFGFIITRVREFIAFETILSLIVAAWFIIEAAHIGINTDTTRQIFFFIFFQSFSIPAVINWLTTNRSRELELEKKKNELEHETAVRKKAEEDLQKSEELYRMVFVNMIDGFSLNEVIYNDQGEPLDFRILQLNSAYEKMTGIKQEAVGKTILELFPSADKEMIRTYNQVGISGEPLQMKYYSITFNRFFSVSVFSPKKNIFACIFEDITEAKLAEEKVSQSENQMIEAQALAGIGNYEFELPEGKAAWSRELFRIFGRSSMLDAPTYPEFFSYIHPDDKEWVRDKISGHIEAKNDFEIDFRIINPEKGVRTVSMVCKLHKNLSGTVYQIRGIIQDVTERKRMETELALAYDKIRESNEILEEKIARTREELEQKNRVLVAQSREAAMGEMIRNIAHQWRQPLNNIGLILQNFETAYQTGNLDPAYLEKSIQKGMNIIQYMSQTIDDFRNFFKPNRDESRFSVNDVIFHAVGLLDASFKYHNIQVDCLIDGEFFVFGYPNELAQAILSILQNSKDAFIEHKEKQPLISLRLYQNSASVILEIQDNAGGIPAEVQTKIFEPYFTTKENGTGIGLYMVRAIIESNMHGKVAFKNTENGVLFILHLPLHGAEK